jgi:2-(1,2-epoxy-1,2-dihydrophenyl)acetyl-CoA isomerase
MAEPPLLSRLAHGVMTLTLNRPEKLNAIDKGLSRALLAELAAASGDPSVRAVLVRGNGRAFCAGRDVTNEPTEEDLELVQAVSEALVKLPKPVVAAVHGWTVGAGLEWMLNADVVVAASSARFKLPEASLGVFVTGGLSATLPACAGLARAKALLLLGEEFSPQDAQAWGLVWRVVSPAELAPESERVANSLAAIKPQVAGEFKRVLNETGLQGFYKAIELENDAQRRLARRLPAEGDG